MAALSHAKLENKLTKINQTMPDKIAPNAYCNMKKGYGLWKEGYVRTILVKAKTPSQERGYFWLKLRLVNE